MKVAVVGLWHLGSVTAACLAGFGADVIGFEADETVVNNLKKGIAPLYEPGLNELIVAGQQQRKLSFTSNDDDLADAEIFWITYDTPVDEKDIANTSLVKESVIKLFSKIKDGAVIIISSQMPAGSTRELAKVFQEKFPEKQVFFAYSPENLRLGDAVRVFTQPDRIIMGVANEEAKEIIAKLLYQQQDKILWMSIESAEMTKHAINAFLAMSVTFINELATVCEQVGASAREVEQGLKSEARIGVKAYLKPGGAFAGGTLARDVRYLIELGKQHNLPSTLFSAIIQSNDDHKQWLQRRLETTLGTLKNKKIAILGLAYKPGTDTLRRSLAIEICLWLSGEGAQIKAYDPVVNQLPENFQTIIDLCATPQAAMHDADALVITTEWPEFKLLESKDFSQMMVGAKVYDANGFLRKNLQDVPRVDYFCVGDCI